MFSNSKKSQSLFTETVLIVISIVFLGLLTLMLFISISASENSLECVPGSVDCDIPELIYKFPTVYTHTFLQSTVPKSFYSEENSNLKYDEENPLKVKDLIWIDTEDSLAIVEEFRKSFNSQIPSKVHENYKEFSGDSYTSSSLIKIYPGSKTVPNIEESFRSNNYYFHSKTSKGTFTLIYFKPIIGGSS